MSSSDEYKRQIMKDLAHGSTESMSDDLDQYQTFDDFAQRSSTEKRRNIFARAFQHDRISPQQLEPELQKAIAQIKPNERDDVAKEFLRRLKERNVSDRNLQYQLGLSSHDPHRMTSDDVSKLASYTYHSYPDIFQDVLADRPALVKFLSNPVVGAVLGAVAAKWFSHHR